MIAEGGEASNRVAAMALSADGGRVAVASGDKEIVVRVWDAAGGKELCKLEGKLGDCSSLAFSPDGKALAAAASLEGVGLWDATTGKALKGPVWEVEGRAPPLDDPKPSPAAGLAFSPSGKSLAVMSGFSRERWAMFDKFDAGRIRVHDVATGKKRFELDGQEAVAAFSPDGKTLATGSRRDQAVYLWDAVGGKQLARFEGHRGAITALAFTADGRRLISGSADSAALVWDVSGKGR
jgi:WD40 repeat protein